MANPMQQQALQPASSMMPAGVAGVSPVKKHQHMIDMDCLRIRNTEPDRPFSGMQDAVERLLPFHVLAAADACEADTTQAAAENLQLTAGRRDTWDWQQAQTAFELSTRIEQLRSKVAEAQAHMDSGTVVRPEDRLVVERHLHTQARARLDELKQQRAKQAQEEADRRAAAIAVQAQQQQEQMLK